MPNAVDSPEQAERCYQLRGTIVREWLEYAQKTGLFRDIESAFPAQQNE
jgi:hypothetical protein